MSKVKVRRTLREELPGVAVLRDAAASSMAAFPASHGTLDLDMDVDPDLLHLLTHDPDGFFTAVEKDETLGFAAAHVRSRQWVLSQLWVLPQHRGKGAGEALVARTLAYGERSGAREFLALVPVDGPVQGLLYRHEFRPLASVFLVRIARTSAGELGAALSRLLPAQDVTSDLLARRGQADLDRIDRLARSVTREVDHQYWLKTLGRRVAFVRQGARIAAFAYGGQGHVGPVVGTTQDAAMTGLGWAINLTLKAGGGPSLDLLLPAAFAPAVDAAFEFGGRITATFAFWGRGIQASFDRSLPGSPGLP
jgi:ribosomal protein S18 acetylase RimI-like enzyme